MEVRVRHGLGTASRAVGDVDTAVEELKKAVEISRQWGMTDQEMESLVQQAASIVFTGADLEQALRFYDDAAARARAVGRKAEESFIL
jgi:hypothetical protein